MKIGILGGGLTGLSLGYFLRHDFNILEKDKGCGGLCRSIREEGFTFDCAGGHILFSRNRQILEEMVKLLGKNCLRKRRNNKIYYKDRFIKYPFENGLSGLPLKENIECLIGYFLNKSGKPNNFKEWLYYTFGRGITEKYLIPYNEKIWKINSETLDLRWVDGRVPKPGATDIIKSSMGIATEGYRHQLYFYYPAYGGIQTLIESLKNRFPDKVETDFTVKLVTRKNGKWVITDGSKAKEYDVLVSTIPLFELVSLLENVPDNVTKALNKLKYLSLITVMLGFERAELPDFLSIYFPDVDIPCHRICFPKQFSENSAPSSKSSLMAEITIRQDAPLWKEKNEDIVNKVTIPLCKKGILKNHSIIFKKIIRTKYAYVLYDSDYYENLKTVKDYVNDIGIYLCGRFAEFEYLNMDACFERASKLAEKLNLTNTQ